VAAIWTGPCSSLPRSGFERHVCYLAVLSRFIIELGSLAEAFAGIRLRRERQGLPRRRRRTCSRATVFSLQVRLKSTKLSSAAAKRHTSSKPIETETAGLSEGNGGRGRNRIINLTYFQQHAGQRMTPKTVKSIRNPINRAPIERRILAERDRSATRCAARSSGRKEIRDVAVDACRSMYCNNRRGRRRCRAHDGKQMFTRVKFSSLAIMMRMIREYNHCKRVNVVVFALYPV
jgi:hypothetical protein